MKKAFLFFISILFTIPYGCDSTTDPSNTATNKSLKGIVKDNQGNLLSNAKVFIIYDYGQQDPNAHGHLKKPLALKSVVLDGPYATVGYQGIKLYWITYSENNNKGFEIERKQTNTNWSTIGFVAGKGTTADTSNYEFIDPFIENGMYTFRLKIIALNDSSKYSDEVIFNVNFLPNKSHIEQNYPNPFSTSTKIRFTLRKPTLVSITANPLKKPGDTTTFFTSQLGPGNYEFIGEFYDSLPSNGYKASILFIEKDTTYLSWIKILQTYDQYVSSIVNTMPNAITTNGNFEMYYGDLPIGEKFVKTGPESPEPFGEVIVGNKLTLVIYKPGYKVVQKEVIINLAQGQDVGIILEKE